MQTPPLHHRTPFKEMPYIANYDTDAIDCKNCKQTCEKMLYFNLIFLNTSLLEVSENRFLFVYAPWSLFVKGYRIFQWLMVVPSIGCYERSSHVSWNGDLHLQKVWKIKLPPREKGILEDFMWWLFPYPSAFLCIGMDWTKQTQQHKQKLIIIVPQEKSYP